MISATRKILKILDRTQQAFAAGIVVLMIIGALLESLGITLIYPLVEAISSSEGWDRTWYGEIIAAVFGVNEHRNYIAVLITLTIAVFIFKNLYLLMEKWIQCSFIAKCRIHLQKQLMHRYLHKPYDFYLNASSGEIIRIITADSSETFNILTSILSIYTDGLICVVLAATIIVMDPAISCVFMAVFAVNFIVVSRVVKPVMVRLGDRNRYCSAKANRWILESLNGIKSIKVSSTENFFEGMYRKNADASIDSQRKNATISAVPKLFNETLSVSAALAYVLVLVISGAPLSNIIPILSVFAIAALRLMPCINSIAYQMNSIAGQKGGLENILNVIETENPDDIEDDEQKDECSGMSFCDRIELSDIAFAYPNAERAVIKDGSLTVTKGQSVGIVGVSGGGKTTTADIILGLLRPQQGHVIVDGRDISGNMDGWHSIISYVPQQVFIMDDSVRANVAFGIPEEDISDERVWKAIEDAQLAKLVREMPEGINTKVGERGIRLSGGQCQRLGIARALYREPEIILFDEATSALDNETEKAIMQSIDSLKGNKTLIIIAHRLTTIQNCDVIYRVENCSINVEKHHE